MKIKEMPTTIGRLIELCEGNKRLSKDPFIVKMIELIKSEPNYCYSRDIKEPRSFPIVWQ